MSTATGIQVIERAAKILRVLKADNDGQSLGMIASKTDLPRSTVQRIVNSLLYEGFVASSGQDSGLRLGPEIQSLAAASRVDVSVSLRPALKRLSQETGETVDLAYYANRRMTIIDQIPGRHRLSAVSTPGEDFPLTTTANGKAILSRLSSDDVEAIFVQEDKGGGLSEFFESVESVRQTGIAFDEGEHTLGISAVGIAFQTNAEELFAVSIPVPSERFQLTRTALTSSLSEFYVRSICSSQNFVD